MSELTQHHLQRFGALKADRGNWNQQWEEAAARILPAHVNSFYGTGSMTAGAKNTEQQYDSTAAFAAQRFSSVIESLATPQSAIWHRLVPTDKTLTRNRSVRMFFDDLSDLLFSYRYRPVGNFVGNSQQVYLGLGCYGNGVVYVDQPDNERGLRYRNIHLGEAYFAENHAGIVDTLYRLFELTAKQMVQQFGAAVPDAVKAAAAEPTQSNKKFEVLHCVYPREDHNPMRMDGAGKKFASLYIAPIDQSLMREGGFDTFPFAIARYTQASGEIYGRGPAQWVLPAIKVLNEEKRTVLKQGHRVVDPVLLAHDDGTLGSFSMKAGALNPGGVSKEGRLLVQPLPTGNIAIGDKLMQMEKDVINDAFLITLFQILIDSPQMTATEVLERAREKGMLLAPTAGRLQAEFLGPLIERELALMAAQGIWPSNMPAILRGGEVEFKIEYDSPMSRMQRAEKAGGFMRALDMAANYAKNTMDPAPLDFFNFDVAMPEILDINGCPTAWTRSIEDVLALREERAEAVQQQQMIDAAPAMASVAKSIPQQGQPA